MLTRTIASQIKAALNGFDMQRMHDQMRTHYKTFQLLNDIGKWTIPALQKISSELLPGHLDENAAKNFVDQMAALAEKNPYLIDFLEKVKNEKFESLHKKISIEGPETFPDLLAFAMVLERLTLALYNDPGLALDCIEYFRKKRLHPGAFRYRSFFHKLKLNSIERPFHKKTLQRAQTGTVPPDSFRWSLPVNIFEACVTDLLNGNKNNSRASWPLIVNRPGNRKDDPKTGAGPSRWSEDKKAVSLHMPLPKEWADLYQTWNMAFVIQFPFYLYILPKLFIPQVANYQEKPSEYIHNRVLALYLTLNYYGFRTAISQKNNMSEPDWTDKKLTELWGRSNLESAVKYKKAVFESRNT